MNEEIPISVIPTTKGSYQVRILPPPSCKRIVSGNVLDGDLLWDPVNGWEPAPLKHVGAPAWYFNAVARKIGAPNK